MPKNSKTKQITLDPQFFIEVVDNDFYFSVQQAFQALGIVFLDLNTGQIIRGNANIDTLGMLGKMPKTKRKRTKGIVDHFLIPRSTQEQKSFDVEATLNIYEPKDSQEPLVFTIQILNQNDLEFWYKIVANVGKNFIELDKFGDKIKKATFRIVPLALPINKSDTSAISAMQGNIQRYRAGSSSSYAVSNCYLGNFDEDEYDEEEE